MTLTDTVSQAPAGHWVTPNYATGQLGISERTLFRRLASGKLRRRTLDDGRIEVWLPLTVDHPTTDTVSVEASVNGSHVSDSDRHVSWIENGHTGSTPSDGDNQVDSRLSDTDRQSQALVLFEQFNTAVALQVRGALAPVERERDRLLQVSIDQAERIGRLEAELAAATTRRSWWGRLFGQAAS
jgi:hypothetical protein